jgi:hypothetical protein
MKKKQEYQMKKAEPLRGDYKKILPENRGAMHRNGCECDKQ